jgi:hypothetical protein
MLMLYHISEALQRVMKKIRVAVEPRFDRT